MSNSKKKLITHNGSFHTDDIFAAAALILYLEKTNKDFSAQGGPASGWEIIRTRDQDIIEAGDFVFDVGGIYDREKNRFDHHQQGGAGRRVPSGVGGQSGIEYASFGLVWQKYGSELCGNQKSADLVDRKLVSPIDAGDNGINLVEPKSEVVPYFIQNAFNSFNPTWKDTSEETLLSGFLESVKIAEKILRNEIARAKDIVEAEGAILAIYQSAPDKRIIILDKKYLWYEQIQNYPEPIYVVYPRQDGSWGAEGVGANKTSFEKRKKFPEAWAGLRDEELQKVSGVNDGVFCHRARFMAVAKTKEGAIKLAQIAVEF